MFIIWGQKPYFKTQKVKSHGFCVHCDNFVKRHSFYARTFFHLYYIPLVPTTARVRHHQTCPKCQQYLSIPGEEFEQTVSDLQSRAAETVVALLEGESTITFAAQPTLAEDKAMKKAYAKARKKAGVA